MSLVVTVSYEPDGSPSLRDRKLEMKVRSTYAQSKPWAEAGLARSGGVAVRRLCMLVKLVVVPGVLLWVRLSAGDSQSATIGRIAECALLRGKEATALYKATFEVSPVAAFVELVASEGNNNSL